MHEPGYRGFEWDADKDERCRQERGFGFDDAAKLFDGDFILTEDRRRDYGEERFVAIGEANAHVFTVVWTPRGDVRRIISARPASKSERERFYEYRETHDTADS